MKLFSHRYENDTDIWTIFGINFKIKNAAVVEMKSRFFEIEHNMQYERILKERFDEPINEMISNKIAPLEDLEKGMNAYSVKKVFETEADGSKNFRILPTYVLWGIRPTLVSSDIIAFAHRCGKDVIFFEDGFLKSADTAANKKCAKKYVKGVSYTVDDLSSYYDATKETRMEQMLNDKNLVITEEQKQRARRCIDKIVETHLTKYNHQPIVEPKIGGGKDKKVLVIDQSYGDMSILKGLGDENTFKKMLECAISENPDADIIVKTHPDTMAGKNKGYYTGLKPHDNIYTLTDPINPISLIKAVDKVYVCSTQFGFEALMCGKEVRVFGMPFYAGWGLTQDDQICKRRTNTRTLEEMFYIAYILYTRYINPEKQCSCEIEEAMDYLLKLREEYFEIKK